MYCLVYTFNYYGQVCEQFSCALAFSIHFARPHDELTLIVITIFSSLTQSLPPYLSRTLHETYQHTHKTIAIVAQRKLDNAIKFADFLDCAHAHMQVENVPDEILRAFKVSPFTRKDQNNIPIDTLRHLICNWGEKFSHREFNALIKEMNLNRPEVSYSQFVNSLVVQRRPK